MTLMWSANWAMGDDNNGGWESNVAAAAGAPAKAAACHRAVDTGPRGYPALRRRRQVARRPLRAAGL
jgi:hypothetical protein